MRSTCGARRSSSRPGSPALSDGERARALFRTAAELAAEHGLKPWRVEALLGLGTIELMYDEAPRCWSRPGIWPVNSGCW